MIAVLKQIAPWIIVLIGFFFILKALVGKTEWLLMSVIALMPLRNVVEKLHTFPLGKDFIDIFFITLLIGIVVRGMIVKDNVSTKSPVNPIIYLIIFYTFISLLLGSNYLGNYMLFDPSDTRVQAWKNFSMMLTLFVITLHTIRDEKWVWRTVAVMCFVMVLMDMYLVRQISWYTSIESRVKIHGTFVHLGPNEVAAFYNQFTVLLLGLFFYMKSDLKKMAILTLIIVNIFCVLFLFSRAAYIGLATGLFFLFAIKKKILLIPLILIIVCWQMALPQKVQDRILMTTNAYGELDRSSELRLIVWQHSIDLFNENPIIGVGYGVFSRLGYELGDTHNIYLKVLAEQGLFGIGIFLLLLFVLFMQGIKLFFGGKDDLSRGLGLGFAICIIVMCVNNMFGDRWTYIQLNSYLWVFAALVSRLNIISDEAQKKHSLVRKKQLG